METKHTKGKWILLDDFSNMESEEGKSIASFYWNTHPAHTTMIESETEGKHNALLSSKSPEMFSLLVEIVENYYNDKHPTISFINEIEKLIKEATQI